MLTLDGLHLYIGSAPRLAEDVAFIECRFPRGTRAKLASDRVPNLIRRHSLTPFIRGSQKEEMK